jgi:hypothetical protein|tara:strand:- start:167 stop:787 length:621 start_codon:yes stop_codon:yes gene_type:complete
VLDKVVPGGQSLAVNVQASLHLDDQVIFCWHCGHRLPDVGDRCPQCGRRARISASVWYVIAAAVATFQLGWAIYHDRHAFEVVSSAVAELAIVGAFVWLLVNYSGALNRKGRASFGLSFLVCWLLTAAICVPIFTGAGRGAEEMTASESFATVVVFVPLLIGLVSAVPLSRGWRTSAVLMPCHECDTNASIRSRYCMACGVSLRKR